MFGHYLKLYNFLIEIIYYYIFIKIELSKSLRVKLLNFLPLFVKITNKIFLYLSYFFRTFSYNYNQFHIILKNKEESITVFCFIILFNVLKLLNNLSNNFYF